MFIHFFYVFYFSCHVRPTFVHYMMSKSYLFLSSFEVYISNTYSFLPPHKDMIYFLLMSLLFGQISYSCLFCSTPYGEIFKLCFLFPSIASYHSRACCFRHLMIMYPILFSYTPTNSYISYSCLFLSPFVCYISYYCYSTRHISYMSLFYPSDDVKISNPSLISISSW